MPRTSATRACSGARSRATTRGPASSVVTKHPRVRAGVEPEPSSKTPGTPSIVTSQADSRSGLRCFVPAAALNVSLPATGGKSRIMVVATGRRHTANVESS